MGLLAVPANVFALLNKFLLQCGLLPRKADVFTGKCTVVKPFAVAQNYFLTRLCIKRKPANSGVVFPEIIKPAV